MNVIQITTLVNTVRNHVENINFFLKHEIISGVGLPPTITVPFFKLLEAKPLSASTSQTENQVVDSSKLSVGWISGPTLPLARWVACATCSNMQSSPAPALSHL